MRAGTLGWGNTGQVQTAHVTGREPQQLEQVQWFDRSVLPSFPFPSASLRLSSLAFLSVIRFPPIVFVPCGLWCFHWMCSGGLDLHSILFSSPLSSPSCTVPGLRPHMQDSAAPYFGHLIPCISSILAWWLRVRRLQPPHALCKLLVAHSGWRLSQIHLVISPKSALFGLLSSVFDDFLSIIPACIFLKYFSCAAPKQLPTSSC